MAFKPNYNQQRADRDRAKQAKKQDKLRLQQDSVAQRRMGGEAPLTTNDDEGAQ